MLVLFCVRVHLLGWEGCDWNRSVDTDTLALDKISQVYKPTTERAAMTRKSGWKWYMLEQVQ